MDKSAYRRSLGEQLRQIRLARGLTVYKVAKDGAIRIAQVQAVESGASNYTIDILHGYLLGCRLDPSAIVNL